MPGATGRRIEGAQGLGSLSAERPDELAIVVVGDLAGPVVELELLEGGQGTVALLCEQEALPLLGREVVEPIVLRSGLAQERARHEGDAGERERDGKDDRDHVHGQAGE